MPVRLGARKPQPRLPPSPSHPKPAARIPPPDSPYLSGNALVCGDNLEVLKDLPPECVDLIYLDPPFNSNHNYVAAFGDKGSVEAQLRDIWRWTAESETQYQRLEEGPLRNAIDAIRLVSGEKSPMAAYALFMGQRLVELHRVLKPTGSIYLHCDYNANWCLRVLLNAVFGGQNFRNEIVWCYSRPSAPKQRQLSRVHDAIFWFAKSKKWTFNPDEIRQPYAESSRSREGYAATASKVAEGTVQLDGRGKFPESWIYIPPLKGNSAEYIGYPTQKPSALLERIIKASSNEGDLVLDPFCGCGTAADAAAKLGRKYLGIDVSAIAVRVMEQRLASRGGAATPVVYKMGWEDYEWKEFERRALIREADAENGQPGWAWAEDKVAGFLNALPNGKKIGDGGVDARYFTEKGEVIPIQVKMHRGRLAGPKCKSCWEFRPNGRTARSTPRCL